MKALIRILQYLNATKTMGIKYRKLYNYDIHVTADASHAIHDDGYSHSGFLIHIGDSSGPIFAKSKKQTVLGENTTDSEMIALHSCLFNANMIKLIFDDLKIRSRVYFYQDNTSAITLYSQHTAIEKKKPAIKTKIASIRESCERLNAGVIHTRTNEMFADALTKPLTVAQFLGFRPDILGMKEATDKVGDTPKANHAHAKRGIN